MQLINHSNNVQLFDKNFEDKIQDLLIEYDFKVASGICTDVGEFKKVLDVVCMNISAGYMNEHETTEIGFISKMMQSLKFIEAILTKLQTKTQYHPTQVPQYMDYHNHYNFSNESRNYLKDWENYNDYDDCLVDELNELEANGLVRCESCLNWINEKETCQYCNY